MLNSAAPGNFGEFISVIFTLLLIPALLVGGGIFVFNFGPKLWESLNAEAPDRPFEAPPAENFRLQLATAYQEAMRQDGGRPLVSEFRSRLFDFFTTIYSESFHSPISTERRAAQSQASYDALLDIFVECLRGFTRELPSSALEPEPSPAPALPFLSSTAPLDFLLSEKGKLAWASEDIGRAYQALAAPFTPKTRKRLRELGAIDWRGLTFTASEAPDVDAPDSDWDEHIEKAEKGLAKLPPHERVCDGTPFFGRADRLLPKGITVTAPLPIEDKDRFEGQFIIGKPGTGKTTFISAQIKHDLDRVARGEASIFVMDSQNELIPDIARLARFAPGGDLHGKLVYLEPDPDHPLALNFFAFDHSRLNSLPRRERDTLIRGAEEATLLFVQSLFDAPVTGHMRTIFLVGSRALRLIPDATLSTLGRILTKGGLAEFDEHLSALDEDDHRFLSKEMFGPEFTQSLGAIRGRIVGLTADEVFKSMFLQKDNRFDLFNLLQDSKVVVVNTMKGYLKNATEPFGRFFLSKLLQVTEERMLLDRDRRMPVYAYIDEAADYIGRELAVKEMIFKARKQFLALTFATQDTTGFDPAVIAALEGSHIVCRGIRYPRWEVTLRGEAPHLVVIPPVHFAEMPRMGDREFADILDDMHNRFSGKPRVSVPMRKAASETPPKVVKLRQDEEPPAGDWSR